MTVDEDFEELPTERVEDPEHFGAAMMLSFGAVHPGREKLAVDLFTDVSRHLGERLTEGAIASFKPYFYADGQQGDVSGFFLIEGGRERIDALRRDEAFGRMLVRVGAAVSNVRVHTLVAGPEAGRLVNVYREVREELGLL